MSIIYNTIKFFGDQKREFKKAKVYNTQENNKLKVKLSKDTRVTHEELTKDEIKNLKQDEQLRLARLNIKQERAKGTAFLIFSLVASVISAMFSICGLNGVKNIGDCVRDVPSTMITSVFIFFAVLSLAISYYDTYHNANYYDENNKLKVFQIIFVGTSIVSNFMFLHAQGIHPVLAGILSSLLDMSGIFCGNIANAKKYKNRSTAKTAAKKESLTYMVTQIISKKLRGPIEQIYMNIIDDYEVENRRKIVSNVVNTGFFESVKDEDNMQDRSDVMRTSASKMTKDKLYELISKCEDGEIITPKKVNMQGVKNFYNWMDKCDMVQKVNSKYVKCS